MTNPLVTISCITYNHGKFIRDCLEGFLMQETKFPFEILIHDDASTDETPQILREYARKYDFIKLLLQKENQYSKGQRGMNIKFNFPRARGKYIALCEGDDYWTDPLKLQKQVDFLEKNPSYTFCFTRFYTLDQDTQQKRKDQNSRYFSLNQDVEFDFCNFRLWHIGTQTVVFRNFPGLTESIIEYKNPVDIHIYVELLKAGKGKCLKDFCAVYRNTGNGVYTSENNNSRLIRGVKMYEEIYLKNKNNKYLKQKFLMFSRKYLVSLIERKKYRSFFYYLFRTTKATLNLKFFLRSLFFIR